MKLRHKSARMLLFLVGIIALLLAIKFGQGEKVVDFLTGFKKYELAGYKG